MPRQGWAKRQIENTTKNISQWPAWMRREAGIEKSKEDTRRGEKVQRPKEQRDG